MNLRRWILHNFWLKLISLGLASLIWLAVHYQIESDRIQVQPRISHIISKQYRNVNISKITSPSDTRHFRISPEKVLAVAVGEEDLLGKVSAENLSIYVDLTDFHSIRSTNAELHSHAPADVSIIGIQPTTVLVEQISP